MILKEKLSIFSCVLGCKNLIFVIKEKEILKVYDDEAFERKSFVRL